MNELSFNIKTTEDFFKKLIEEFNVFQTDRTSSRVALNCAMTAWHLTEWAYNEFNGQLVSQFKTLASYQQELKQQCPSLQIMHDIANGTKHYLLTRHQPVIKETKLHKGAFSSGFSRGFDISTLDIELNDETKIYFEDEIEKTISFLKNYLQSTFSLTI